MAVPIPKKTKNSIKLSPASETFSLQYSGKKTVESILTAVPGEYRISAHYSAGQNRLYHADNLGVLAALLADKEVAGKIRLVYIDPPFATGAFFESREQQYAYNDYLVGTEYIESLRERLVLIHRLLAEDGSLYLHLDENMVFCFRIILDEIFGAKNYRNCITRKKCNPKNYTRKTYGNVSDYILFYTKSDSYVWNRPMEPWNECNSLKEYPCVDENGRRYKKVPVHAPGTRNGETGKEWRGKLPPPGKHWQYTPATLDKMDANGEIYWSPTGNPRRKVYLDNSQGIPIQDIWMDVRDAHNQNIRVTGYPTEKNLAMLKRIIGVSSNPGDLVLDCYAGSGTTLAAASEMERKWIGIDRSNEAIKTILNRLECGSERMGDFITLKTPQMILSLQKSICYFTLYASTSTTSTCRDASDNSFEMYD